jgi:hypothetical protein
MSSMLDRCRLRIIPSATDAESNDSIAPRSAIVIAGDTRSVIACQDTCGILGAGKVLGTDPKRLPMVSTGI